MINKEGKIYSTPEEMGEAAEAFLDGNSALKDPSNIRAAHHKQQYDPSQGFMSSYDLFPDSPTRREPTQDERERLDRSLTDLGQLFQGSGVRWHIDGALNISLMKGNYIGAHKDIDIAVEAQDLELLDAWLEKHGYGLFLSGQEGFDDMNTAIRAWPAAVRREHVRNLAIARIDKQGKITEQEGLNFLDVHLIRRNPNNQIVNGLGVVMPEAWSHGPVKEFHGTTLNLAHPAQVAYFKMRQNWSQPRLYDEADLHMLVEFGNLQLADVDEIQDLLQQERSVEKQHAHNLALSIHEAIAREPELSEMEIDTVISSYPPIKQTRGSRETSGKILDLTEQIVGSPDKSVERMADLALEVFAPVAFYSDQAAKIEKLKQWIKEAE